MKATKLTPGFILSVLVGCSQGPGGDTPEAAFESMRQAQIAKDGGKMYDCFAPSARKKMEDMFAKNREEVGKNEQALAATSKAMGVSKEDFMKMSVRDMMVKMIVSKTTDKEIGEAKGAKIIDKKLEGDTCSLKIKSGEEEKWIKFVREEGRWYFGEMK